MNLQGAELLHLNSYKSTGDSPDDGKEKDKKSRSSIGGKEKDKDKANIPGSYLNKTAPEIILGGEITAQCSLYAVGILCTWIFTQKPLIKVRKIKLNFPISTHITR